jgi:hypothetical protein
VLHRATWVSDVGVAYFKDIVNHASLFVVDVEMTIFNFCKACDPRAFTHLHGVKRCPNCQSMVYWRCLESIAEGHYNNYRRHQQSCRHCRLKSRTEQKHKLDGIHEAEEKLAKDQADQEP